MTTDLEKQFFDTFGIGPAYFYECSYKDKLDFGLNPSDDECPAKTSNIRCDACNLGKKVLVGYQAITDSILLELICLLSAYFSLEQENWFRKCTSIKELKDWVLKAFIEVEKQSMSIIPRYQVQALFKE